MTTRRTTRKVTPDDLAAWLREKKRGGWRIVALEQCADSTPLGEVRRDDVSHKDLVS